jgi:enoyl-CoA hydratase
MNRLIATYPKPLIALSHGIVMGGGIGIAGHCRFRLTEQAARFAMPEAAIGFFSDVGVNAILARAPINRALLFLMSGGSVGAADALALGLADIVVPAQRVAEVDAALVDAAAASNPEGEIARLLAAEAVEAGPAEFCARADLLPPDLPGSPEAFVGSVAAIPQLRDVAMLLATRSPSALTTIFHTHLAARRLMDVTKTLEMDLRIARLMARGADFSEGVRAVLVDKDQSPRWSPQRLRDVDPQSVLDAIKAL